jgi:Leucine-rich repeat (LRR) protein
MDMPTLGSTDGSRVQIEVYDYMCEIGNHYVMHSYGPFHCDVCGKVSCRQHIPHYNCCEKCWAQLDKNEKEAKKKAFFKMRKFTIGYFLYSFCVTFLTPFAAWLITKNNFAILGGVIVGIVLWLIPSIKLVLERAKSKEKDKEKIQQMQAWVNTHQDELHAPFTAVVHGNKIDVSRSGPLNLTGQGIKSIKEIHGLEKTNFLTAINLSNNQITKIEGFEACASLQSLTLASNQISKIEGLEGTTMVSLLDLSNNKIRVIEGLEDHWNLKYLYLDGNPIEWPVELHGRKDAKAIVEYCKWLKTKKQAHSTGMPAPPAFGTPHMDSPTTFATPNTDVPTAFGTPSPPVTPTQIKPPESQEPHYVWVRDQMIEVRGGILSLYQKGLTSLKEVRGLEKLGEITTLDLSNNKIQKIEGLEIFPQLKVLMIEHNQITKIEGLDHLKDLTELNLDFNQISKIEGLDKLTQLNQLKLGFNRISKIENLNALSQLLLLDLRNNNITKLEGLNPVPKLMQLHLQNNQINAIEGLEGLNNLVLLNLKDNPVASLVANKKPQEIVAMSRPRK